MCVCKRFGGNILEHIERKLSLLLLYLLPSLLLYPRKSLSTPLLTQPFCATSLIPSRHRASSGHKLDIDVDHIIHTKGVSLLFSACRREVPSQYASYSPAGIAQLLHTHHIHAAVPSTCPARPPWIDSPSNQEQGQNTGLILLPNSPLPTFGDNKSHR